MDITESFERHTSLGDLENWFAIGAGTSLLIAGMRRRSAVGTVAALSSVPLLYRGIAGHWPQVPNGDRIRQGHGGAAVSGTKATLSGDRGVHVRESIRLELPTGEVYRFWRHLANLPRFMSHLDRVTETSDGQSHWIAKGPAGLGVEWDARIVNEEEGKVIGWQSLPGSDVDSAGSVNFDSIRNGRATQLSVHLQYSPPAGKAGALIAKLFGEAPSQTVREDLRRLKQLLEAGEVPCATPQSA
jgi:uncharacterized membrane protein